MDAPATEADRLATPPKVQRLLDNLKENRVDAAPESKKRPRGRPRLHPKEAKASPEGAESSATPQTTDATATPSEPGESQRRTRRRRSAAVASAAAVASVASVDDAEVDEGHDAEAMAQIDEPIDHNSDHCYICNFGGDLLCCDGCPNAVHKECAQLKRIPKGDWFCAHCRASQSQPKADKALAAGSVNPGALRGDGMGGWICTSDTPVAAAGSHGYQQWNQRPRAFEQGLDIEGPLNDPAAHRVALEYHGSAAPEERYAQYNALLCLAFDATPYSEDTSAPDVQPIVERRIAEQQKQESLMSEIQLLEERAAQLDQEIERRRGHSVLHDHSATSLHDPTHGHQAPTQLPGNQVLTCL